MSEIKYYSEEGLRKLKEELHQLISVARPAAAAAIAEARDKGDLSENAEYDAAKEAQGHLESRISRLQDLVANARLLDESKLDVSKILLLSKITIRNVNNDTLQTYTIVPESEADLKNGRISVSSPLAKGFLGHKAGEKVSITVPAGVLEFEILKVER